MKTFYNNLKGRYVGFAGRCLQTLDRWSPVDLHINRLSFMTHTFLFRDLEHCREMLTEYYTKVGRELKILCVGCSKGQEPYSIAILCHDIGIPVKITAFDLSAPAIDIARQGAYDLAAERQKAKEGPDDEALRLLDKYDSSFDNQMDSDGKRTVRREIQETVEFIVKDVEDLQYADVFDLIFCKKMMWYLPKAKRHTELVAMQRALKTGAPMHNIIFDSYTKRLLKST